MRIINLISKVLVLGLHQVEDWKNLPVVWNESFSNSVTALDKGLKDFESYSNDFWVSSVKCSYNGYIRMYLTFKWNNELRNDRKDLGTSIGKHIENTFNCQESVRVILFSNSFKEDWEVMMVVKLLNFYFPLNLVLRSVFN